MLKSRQTAIQNILSILLLLFVTLAFFWRVPVQGRVLLPLDVLHTYEPWRSEVPGALGVQQWNPWRSDEVRQFYPVLNFVQSTWRQGQIPFWSSHNATGLPIMAHGYDKVFYPLLLILISLVPSAHALSWHIILHTFLGAIFTYLFLREIGSGPFGGLVAAITFVFGGYLVILMPSVARFPGIVWLPLLLWALERSLSRKHWGWFVAGILVLLMQLLAGHLQVVLYSLTGVGFYALYRAMLIWFDTRHIYSALRPLLFIVLITIVSLGLAAFQILPTLELAGQGVRTQAAQEATTPGEFEGIVNDVPVATLLQLVIPDVLGNDLDKNIAPGFTHSVYMYFGLLPLFFVAASLFSTLRRLAWGMVGIALLVWLVMFKVPPIYQLFEFFYPSFKELGFHRAQMLTALFGAAAAGLGADWLIRERPVVFIKKLFYAGVAVAGLLVAVLVGLAYAAKYQQRFFWPVPLLENLQPEPVYLLTSLIFGLLFLCTGLWLLWLWANNKIGRATFGGVALALVVVDLFLAHMDYIPARDPKMLYPITPSLAIMQQLETQNEQPVRMMSVNRLFWGNMSAVFGFDDVQGYDSFLLKRYSDYVDLTQARADANFRIAAFEAKTSKFLDALNVKYIYAPRYKLADGDWISLLNQVDVSRIESPHSYAGQPDEWILSGWPQPVLLAPTPSEITYVGLTDFPAQLETAIAISPEEWAQPGVDVHFEVYVQPLADSAASKLLFSQQLTTMSAEMKWMSVVIDLSQYAGQEINLTFVTESVGGGKWNAAWANPLLSDYSKVELLHYGPNSIYLNKNYLPRAWTVHQAYSVSPDDLDAAAALMTQPDFTPAQTAVIEGSLPSPVDPPAGDDLVTFDLYSPNRSVIMANLASSGLLVFSDIYYPGWNAYVDGVAQPIYATNIAMRGVYVPAGQHTIEFKYEPLSFKIGLYISLTTLLVLILLGVFWHFKWKKVSYQSEA